MLFSVGFRNSCYLYRSTHIVVVGSDIQLLTRPLGNRAVSLCQSTAITFYCQNNIHTLYQTPRKRNVIRLYFQLANPLGFTRQLKCLKITNVDQPWEHSGLRVEEKSSKRVNVEIKIKLKVSFNWRTLCHQCDIKKFALNKNNSKTA